MLKELFVKLSFDSRVLHLIKYVSYCLLDITKGETVPKLIPAVPVIMVSIVK